MDDLLETFNSYPLGQKVLVFLVVASAVFGVFWFTLYRSLQNQYEQAQSTKRELDRKRQEFRSKLEDQVSKEELQELRAEILLAEDKLPSTTQLPKLLKSIHSKAKTAGLDILNFQRKPEKAQKFYVEIPVAMKLRGTYAELMQFLNFVRTMNRIVSMQDLTLNLEDRATGELVVTAAATTYRYKEGEQTDPNSGDGGSEN